MLRRGGTLAGALALAALLGLPPDQGPGGFWSWLWNAVTAANCDDGLMIDPNGCPRSQGDTGASIDPNGQPAAEGDHGPSIDPNG